VKNNTVAVALGILGIIFVIAAVLYIVGGILPTFTSSSAAGTHTKHAILCAVLAVASFVAANFARVKTV
jgi:accessory gene regulator protein AgrB